MTTIWLVRHGPTHRRDMVGWTDAVADLSDRPRIERLAASLPGDAPVVSSDLSRAVHTADAIQGTRPRLPHDTALREIHFGRWEAKTFDDIQREAPELSRRYWEEPGDIRPPDGESWNDLVARIDAAVDALCQRHEQIVIVAHFGVILTQIQRALGCSAYEAFSHRIHPLSVTRLARIPDGWRAEQINHAP